MSRYEMGLHRYKGARKEHHMRWRGIRYRNERVQVEVEQLLGVYGFPHTLSWRFSFLRVGK